MGSKFVIVKTGKDKSTGKENLTFSFLNASGDTLVAATKEYTSKVSVKAGIKCIQKNVGAKVEDQTVKDYEVIKTPKWEIFKDKSAGFRLQFVATNGKKVVQTAALKTTEEAKKVLASLKKSVAAAPTEDQSLVRQPKAAAGKKAPAKKTAEKKAPAKKTAEKKSPAAKKAPAKKTTAKK